MFEGKNTRIEVQSDPLDAGRFAVYARHDDGANVKPARFLGSFATKDAALAHGNEIAAQHGIACKWVDTDNS